MTLNLMPAVQELHKLDSQDLCRLLKDAGNFSVHHHTGKGVLLEIDMDKLARYRKSHYILNTTAFSKKQIKRCGAWMLSQQCLFQIL
ncbi:unnamed protein product [Trifolium pratense]|uniref:Uncharacterized protein n=1 Tax=Trifolium pratense TaxID=57577 RepID=A0ACB0JBZ4_TRIPR|nr:unnamed protein product [Trifolium pratense]